MKTFDTIILGGGASACMCAMSTKNQKIAIIDNNNKIAKKLLVTGNGRCNITNKNIDSIFFNCNIDRFLNRFNNNSTISFFDKLGLVLYHDEKGRYYPISNSAKSVTSVIENTLNKKQIKLFLNTQILKINKKENKFLIETNNESFICNKVVLALGKYDKSIMDFEFKIKTIAPSLVGLKANVSRGLNNVKLKNVLVKAYYKDSTKEDFGEVLFRENGLSGIVIFNLSSLFARNKEFNGKISINILPNFSKNELYNLLNKRKSLNISLNHFFDGLFVKEISYEILTRAKIDESIKSNLLTSPQLEKLCHIIQNLDFKINGFLENNQVISGGISLDCFDNNLQSKNIPNLFACGEILDVDGECGGYNLQWAWTSGYIVGQNI